MIRHLFKVAVAICLLALVCVLHRNFVPQELELVRTASIGGAILVGLFAQASMRRSPATPKTVVGQRRWFTTLALVAVVVVACGMAEVWTRAAVQVQSRIPGWMATLTAAEPRRPYPREGTLVDIRAEQITDPDHVALRIQCGQPPGYLRGRVYDTYRESRWMLGDQQRTGNFGGKVFRYPLDRAPRGVTPAAAGQSLFTLESSAGQQPWTSLQIHNDPLRGEGWFAPLGAAFLQGRGRLLALDEHDIVRAGLQPRDPYTLFASRRGAATALSSEQRARLLESLEGVSPAVADLAQRLCSRSAPAMEKIRAVESYFQRNFQYAHQPVSVPPGQDLLSYFLLERPPAHCELFASGAVALLRLRGVPCRYVTGYVATEIDEDNDGFWLARNRDAHAWVEAFDDDAGRWCLVEATPGRAVPSDDGSAAVPAEQPVLAATTGATELQASATAVWMSLSIWNAALQTLVKPALALACLAILARQSGRWWPGRRARLSAAHRQWQAQLRQHDRFARRRSLLRRPGETLHQFAARLRQRAAIDDRLSALADWYERYALLRYANRLDDPATVESSPLSWRLWNR